MISVLYVDDERDLCELGKLFLAETGEFSVDICTSAHEALASHKVPLYDAIISDYQMPEMDGIEFLRAVRAQYGDIPFILFTGRGREEVVIQAINYGVDFYLQKGGEPAAQFAELAHKIRIAVERRRALDGLKDSEQRLSDIINFLPDATFAIDRSGTVIAWNRAIEEMTGVPAADMLGKGDYEYAVPFYGIRRKILVDLIFEPDEIIAENYAHIIHEKDVLIADTTLPHPRGHTVTLMGKASPLYNRQGEIVGAIESIRDISALKKTESDLLQTKRDWETIFRAIGHPAVILDAHNRILDANDATVRATGLGVEELKQKHCYEVFHGKGTLRPPPGCPFEGLKKHRKPETQEEDMEVLGGYYHISCTPVFDPAGQLEKVIHIAIDITAQHRAQEELKAACEQMTASQEELKAQFDELALSEQRVRESEARFRELADLLPQVVYEMDTRLRITYANRHALSVFGVTGLDVESGLNALQVICPSDHGRIRQNMEKLIRGEPFDDHEYTATRGDGTTFPALIYSAPIFRSGTRTGFRGVVIDITERREAEEHLRESEERYRIFVETATEGIWAIDADFVTTFTNRKLLEIFGYSAQEMMGRPVWDFVLPEDVEDMKQSLLTRRTGKSGRYERKWVRKDGSLVWCLTSATPLFSPEGKFMGSFGMFTDITERKRIEAEFMEQHRQLDNFMQNLPAGVFRTTVSPPAKRIMANPILAQTFGYDSVEEYMASSLDDAYAEPGARQALIDLLTRDGKVLNVEVRMKKKNGDPVWISMSAVAVPGMDGSVEYLDGILTDITPRKKAEDALVVANQKLKLLNSITRHDVRNQLLALKGFIQVASAKEINPDLRMYLEKIQSIAETISSQIEFTRAYQELGINIPAWLRLEDAIRNTAQPVPVTISDTCRDIEIFADPMLEQVFFNLFENAFRHGKQVTAISIRCEREPETLRISIEDNGIGIRADDKEKIFRQGFGKNTGLGLFLAREILAITGIRIRETGTPGKGARFEILVPKDAFRLLQ